MPAGPENRSRTPLAKGCQAEERDQVGREILYQHNEAKWHRQGELESLASLHRLWGFPEDELIRWLLHQGVADEAMTGPWCIGGGRVRFDGQCFEIAIDGVPSITFRAEDRGEVIDLIAWQPSTGKVASWFGVAFCLGDLDNIFNPGTYFAGGALRVHASPLEWLKADRGGIVIARPELTSTLLHNARRLSFADPTHARRVQYWLQPIRPRVELFIEVPVQELSA